MDPVRDEMLDEIMGVAKRFLLEMFEPKRTLTLNGERIKHFLITSFAKPVFPPELPTVDVFEDAEHENHIETWGFDKSNAKIEGTHIIIDDALALVTAWGGGG